jgi:hypothetical protein
LGLWTALNRRSGDAAPCGRRVAAADACGLSQRDLAGGAALPIEVPLVVVLVLVEGAGGRELGHNRLYHGVLLVLAGRGRDRRLVGVVAEDRRAVLAADIRALTVPRRRIVDPPERLSCCA